MASEHRRILSYFFDEGRASRTFTLEEGININRLPVLLCFFLFFITLVTCQPDTSFTYSKFGPGSVTLVGDSRIMPDGRLRLCNISVDVEGQVTSVGRALYPTPVQLRNSTTATMASFETSFTFSIDTKLGNFALSSPSGMAWGIFPDNRTIGDYGLYLGLMNSSTDNFSNKVFAIEIDTGFSEFPGYNDTSSCHLGVDLTTMRSDPVFDMATPPGSQTSPCIQNRGVFTLHIRYNGLSHILLVDLLDIGGESVGRINTTKNLYPYMNDQMFVGFSGSGIYITPQEDSVYSWNFSSTFTSPVTPSSAPQPSTPPLQSSPPATHPSAPVTLTPGENCTSTPCSNSTSSSNKGLIYGAAAGGAGGLLLLLGLGLGCFCCRGKSSEAGTYSQETIPGGVAVVGPRKFTYKELSLATKNFSQSELLGKGGSGSVYRGILRDSGAMVAVKMIQADRSQELAEKEFQAEVSIINQIRHRNLVQLQGWCNEKGMLCLVYEYLPNGSLDSLLRKEMQAPNTVIPWGTRYNILTGVAAALAYLHEEVGQCILHRDLKPGNILLDVNYNACLADFGLARLTEHNQAAATTMLAGTLGYMAPELPQTGRATTQTDVYSFGVLIVEMICGRRPTDVDRDTQMPLLDCVWAAHAGNDISCVVDAKIRDDRDAQQIERTLLLGLLCCHPDPISRPTMRNARQILTGDSPLPPVPTEKPVVKCAVYSQYGSYSEFDTSHGDGYDPPEAISKASSNTNSKYSSYSTNTGYSTTDHDSFSSQAKSIL